MSQRLEKFVFKEKARLREEEEELMPDALIDYKSSV